MRTVCGTARRVQQLLRRGRTPDAGRAVSPLTGGMRPLLTDRIGDQRRGGAVLDQVDGTTCGSAVLVALAAWADPTELERLDGVPASAAVGATAGIAAGFGARYDERQRQVHRESTRFWPQALGTTPWGMVGWLREHVPVAGPYRVRLIDDRSAADLDAALAATDAALAAGRPVPLLVGALLPRHYCLALGRQDNGDWRVYEPTSAQVRAMNPGLTHRRSLRPVLGFDRLHAVLLPV